MLYMTANVTNMYISGNWWGIQVFVSPYPLFEIHLLLEETDLPCHTYFGYATFAIAIPIATLRFFNTIVK